MLPLKISENLDHFYRDFASEVRLAGCTNPVVLYLFSETPGKGYLSHLF